jgi:hypothetical protein
VLAIHNSHLTTRRLRLLTTALLLALLAALLLAGAAQARPGRPTAKTPNNMNAVATSTPTFKWGKAARAATYQVRVYRGTMLQVKKTGIARLSWKSSKVLTRGVTYTWKVRARKAGVNGPWSDCLKFTVSSVLVGDSYQGGKVAYILHAADPGYSAGQTHGLIAAAVDQSDGIIWALPAFQSASVPGGTGTALGAGSANTDAIIAQNGSSSTFAAGLCGNLIEGGYSDWYLPSWDELHKLYLNRVVIGGFDTTTGPWYWCSSEYPGNSAPMAYSEEFAFGGLGGSGKDFVMRVRAVRTF